MIIVCRVGSTVCVSFHTIHQELNCHFWLFSSPDILWLQSWISLWGGCLAVYVSGADTEFISWQNRSPTGDRCFCFPSWFCSGWDLSFETAAGPRLIAPQHSKQLPTYKSRRWRSQELAVKVKLHLTEWCSQESPSLNLSNLLVSSKRSVIEVIWFHSVHLQLLTLLNSCSFSE